MRPPRFLLLLALLACSDETPAPQDPATESPVQDVTPPVPASMEGSVLVNGNFEERRPPWFAYDHKFWGTFRATNTDPTIGKIAGELELDQKGGVLKGQRMASLVQIIDSQTLPERLRGRYFVAEWEPGDAAPWIEVVVGANDGPVKPRRPGVTLLAFTLAGTTGTSVVLGNRREIVVGGEEVVMGRWIDFDVPVAENFRKAWNTHSDECASLILLATVRVHEYKKSEQGPFRTRVRFDDLYLGPE